MFPLASLKPGCWYITVTCYRCKARLPLFEDLNDGEATLLGNYGLKCPECGHEDSYKPERYLHKNQDDQIPSNRPQEN
jgi:DNA-directed RNA polymerase subunit RPC12/RpoP